MQFYFVFKKVRELVGEIIYAFVFASLDAYMNSYFVVGSHDSTIVSNKDLTPKYVL